MNYQHRWGMSLNTCGGDRKYLNAYERSRFIQAAAVEPLAVHAFCLTLAFTGCRISEALALGPNAIQRSSKIVSIRTLKRRGAMSVREVPIPNVLLTALDAQLKAQPSLSNRADQRLWPWCRTTAWSYVKRVMQRAGIDGPHASPKGLRHGFGVHAVHSGVPLNLVQRWLGHAAMSTTAIYADAVGPEERAIARRMW